MPRNHPSFHAKLASEISLAFTQAGSLIFRVVGGSTIIRPVEARDAAAIAAIYAPSVTNNAVSFEMEPPDAAEMTRRLVATTATHPWLVCERSGDVIGYVYAGTHRARVAYQWSVDVTVYIAARAQRGGVGRALYTSLFALLRLQGFYNAYAGVTLPNAGSVGLHEAVGFQPVGVYRQVGYKFGAWHDVGWWSLELRDKPDDQPRTPLSSVELQTLPAYQSAVQSGLMFLRL